MREDLYKKHMSAEPVAARLPYGILTKLIELCGWKRLELNKLVKFQGVSEASFDSLFRRSQVCVLRGRFLPAERVARFDNPAEQGVFCKDPTLKAFLKSGPAVTATWKILHGFMSLHNRKACDELIEQYANGGDG